MTDQRLLIAALLTSSIAFAQSNKLQTIDAPTVLPIIFTGSVSADHAKTGTPVEAKTTQRVELPNGGSIPPGTRVTGHVVSANGFVYDKTPYAHQKSAVLSVHFDSIQVSGESVPLNVTVRAIASPIASWDAQRPQASDMDPLGTLTQIGGDQLIPSQSEVRNMEGEVVAYNKRGGVYAHLIAKNDCDSSNVEVSVGIYSPSACGAYGFGDVTVTERGSVESPSTLTFVSSHGSPKLWKHTTALLEILPRQTSVGR